MDDDIIPTTPIPQLINLPVGVHRNAKPHVGYKWFIRCTPVQSWREACLGIMPETRRCWGRVLLSGTIVRPFDGPASSHDVRASDIEILDMHDAHGWPCTSGIAPQRLNMEYQIKQTYKGDVNTDDLREECKFGFHAYTKVGLAQSYVG